jgi:diguanylate cyclase
MDTSRAASPRAAPSDALAPQLAKAALRRLALEKLEPTPENYARAYQLEAGGVPAGPLPAGALPALDALLSRALATGEPETRGEIKDALLQGQWDQAERLVNAQPGLPQQGAALADLIDRIVRGVQQGGRQWTSARKKDSLARVLASTRSDPRRLQQRLGQLVQGWETDTPDEAVETDTTPFDDTPQTEHAREPALETIRLGQASPEVNAALWHQLIGSLGGTVLQALPPPPSPSTELSEALVQLSESIVAAGPTPVQSEQMDQLCKRANRVLLHRHHLIDQLGGLCKQLTSSLAELAEDDSWAQGQVDAMTQEIDFGLTARSIRSVSEMLDSTRERQQALRIERGQARDALKALINQMLSELGELGSQTGRFHESLDKYAGVIDKADSLESLAGVVREMVAESRTVQTLVQQAQGRLQYEHARATGLSERVVELETELRRLSQEVSTDQLTQIANRRGLMQAFDAERARLERSGAPLAIGLLDVDNFKRLNDDLGHAAGDTALKALAAVVSKTLRPTDLVARYGGEEFVVLLPDTPLEEGEQILTRLQRSLTGSLFMHEQRQVFVTFSAGVTAYRAGERIEVALERADEALYEAKRTGKNRTCVG